MSLEVIRDFMTPEILAWAHETSGLWLEEASRAVGIDDAYGKSGAESLADVKADAHHATDASLQLTLRMTDIEVIATYGPCSTIPLQPKSLITAEPR